jgi:pyruvate,water dikinase
VILAEEFARRFDGFSIGSNDLTQLILGVDRDSAEPAKIANAQNGVARAVRHSPWDPRELTARDHALPVPVTRRTARCGQANKAPRAFNK